jgi:hypothetical protein
MEWHTIRFALHRFRANHQTVLIASLGAGSSTFLGLWLQSSSLHPWISPWFYLFLAAQFLMIMVGASSTYYQKSVLLESILPSIHNVLELNDQERVTIHHIKSKKHKSYEQLTDYYPVSAGKGREFGFAHGIVGQCFTNREPHSFAIPASVDFEEAMRENWSFNADELVRLSKDRRSFFAFPIGRDGVFARAVLYMDSPNFETFRDERRQEIVKTIQDLLVPILDQILTR